MIRSPLYGRRSAVWILVAVTGHVVAAADATNEMRPDWIERLVSNRAGAASPKLVVEWLTGVPEFRRITSGTWVPLDSHLGKELVKEYEVRNLGDSRARLGNTNQVVWLAENSEIEITGEPVDPTVSNRLGRLYFHSRGEPKTNLWVWVSGQPKPLPVLGTDFQLRRDRGTGNWLLTVVEGRVENVQKTNAWEQLGKVPFATIGDSGTTTTKWLDLPQLRREIQWILRYPAVLHVDDLPWPGGSVPEALVESVRAYESENLREAWSQHEIAKQSLSLNPNLYSDPALVIYRSNLLLGRGRVEEIEPDLLRIASILETDERSRKLQRLAYAILKVAAAVRAEAFPLTKQVDLEPISATEWLAESYYQQSRIRRPEAKMHSGWTNSIFRRPPSLQLALSAAERAIATNVRGTNFWFGWIRKADLEFSHGNLSMMQKALDTLMTNQRSNAATLTLQGFVLAARPNLEAQRDAMAHFGQALEMDPDFTDAWLGLGLLYLRGIDLPGRLRLPFRTPEEAGLACLDQAAALEPGRSLVRSYLGKAQYDDAATNWVFGIMPQYDRARTTRAFREFETAKNLDPNDPTPWLYSGLAKHSDSLVNEAVRDLEQSIDLNNNRAVYRSRLLLDQDLAVRGANLAAIYRDAGLVDVSMREASRSVDYDYANGSAHLFLANSYDALRDPQQFNLRYETPWLNELLKANLLKPVGAGSLSQTISQQEY